MFARGHRRTFPLTLATETAGPTNEHGRLILKDNLPRRFVLSLDDARHSRRLALVEHLQQPRLIHELATSWDRSLDREILLAVE
jgi:hypothetical protein